MTHPPTLFVIKSVRSAQQGPSWMEDTGGQVHKKGNTYLAPAIHSPLQNIFISLAVLTIHGGGIINTSSFSIGHTIIVIQLC